MPEVGGSVSAQGQYRSVVSDIGSGQALAVSAASSTIDKVDYYLDILSNIGQAELDSALESIESLGDFRPGDIAFSYQVPDYSTLIFSIPDEFVAGGSGLLVDIPDTGIFDIPLTSLSPPAVLGQEPGLTSIQDVPDPNSLPNIGAPVAPNQPTITAPLAPAISLPAAPNLTVPNAPTLRELSLPDYDIPLLPEYDAPTQGIAPELPLLARTFSEDDYKYEPHRVFKAKEEMPDWRRLIEALPVYFADRISDREDFHARTYWASRGHELEDNILSAQITYRSDMTRLLNAGEARRGLIDEFLTHRDLIHREVDEIVKEWLQNFELDTLGLARADFEVTTAYTAAYIDLYGSATALYNARVSAYRAAITLYRNELQIALSKLNEWRVLVEAEIVKTDLNNQLASNFGVNVEASTIAAQLYEAQVQALGAEISAFQAEVESFSLQAEVARTGLDIYKGTVAGYIASLSSFKAQFEAFEAKARGIAAGNALEEAQSRVGIANAQAAGANSSAASLEMEIEAEKLKLEARRLGSTFDNQKLKNSLEAVNAGIQKDQALLSISEWAANRAIPTIQNEAVQDEARSAAKYFEQASNSTFRASEQAFRAIAASAQAAAVAQEAAGRSAASLANGAYSALSVSAGLSGAGRISGSEGEVARENRSIGDFLNYTDTVQQVLSA